MKYYQYLYTNLKRDMNVFDLITILLTLSLVIIVSVGTFYYFDFWLISVMSMVYIFFNTIDAYIFKRYSGTSLSKFIISPSTLFWNTISIDIPYWRLNSELIMEYSELKINNELLWTFDAKLSLLCRGIINIKGFDISDGTISMKSRVKVIDRNGKSLILIKDNDEAVLFKLRYCGD